MDHYRDVSLYLSVVGLPRWRCSSAAAATCRAAGASADLILSQSATLTLQQDLKTARHSDVERISNALSASASPDL